MKCEHHWITDWSEVGDDTYYLVCPINSHDGKTYLGQPSGCFRGWQVKRLMERCYAALELPTWYGLPPKETTP